MPIRLEDQISGEAPRLNDATAWWVQVTGRLKPASRLQQVHGNLGPGFPASGARRDGRVIWRRRSEEVRNRSENQGRTAVPHLLVDSASRGTYDNDERQMRALTIIGAVVALVLVARLRERRESSALARNRAPARDFRQAVDGRDARAAHPAAADRKPAARLDWAERSDWCWHAGDSRCCRRPSARPRRPTGGFSRSRRP